MTVLQVADVGFGYDARKLFGGVTFSLALYADCIKKSCPYRPE